MAYLGDPAEKGYLPRAFWEQPPVERKRRRGRAYGGREMSAEHKALQEAVATTPERFFGPGFRLIAKEYPLPTNDRVDVLLADQQGNLVAVEVETYPVEGEIAGVLQALKYPVMCAAERDMDLARARGVLIACELPSSLKGMCRRYGIETIEVPFESL
jgi:RecB family endonuclease NucS